MIRIPEKRTPRKRGSAEEEAAVRCEPAAAGVLAVHLSGRWKMDGPTPSADQVIQQLSCPPGASRIIVNAEQVSAWDSTLLSFVVRLRAHCAAREIALDSQMLPAGIQRLVKLATAVPAKEKPQGAGNRPPFLARIGGAALGVWQGTADMLAFIGEAFVAFCRFLAGRAQFQRSDLLKFIWSCGPQALPIVTLISLLVGLILAFVGAIQLLLFGAQIFVANLVAVAMVRVMGAVMAAVIMAGRTGAAFAAQLGTMQVNEEIDALKTMGISPMEFLVLPRMLALVVMMPVLCVYADVMGIIGGLIVGVGMLNLGLVEYLNQTKASLTLTYFWIGLFYSAVFGVLIALAGCLRGLQCGRSASAVGAATTSAVVTAIVAIVVATAVITFALNVIGI
ncbi:MAG: ABC transporter permease [Desulfobacterales bacterium]|nr:ABC transporter permease [Desulfobacterales bacterium]